MTYVGLDVHKQTVQVAVMDAAGIMGRNETVRNDFVSIDEKLSHIPRGAKYVLESSSVWYGLYRHLTDDLGLDVVLSNPFNTKIIATSLKKTDRIDARQLANLLRGGYIAECYVPDKETVGHRELSRHRIRMVAGRAKQKNYVHGITLQYGVKTKHSHFTAPHKAELRALKDYRIDSHLRTLEFFTKEIQAIDRRIESEVLKSPKMRLLMSIPGVGPYTALTVCAEIGDEKRFPDAHKLCAYAGLVPSVRNSADTVHHGRITKRGSRLLRYVLVEAAHSHVRFAPDSDLSDFYKRVAKKRGKSKAAVATAAKLLRIIYWMLKDGNVFVVRRDWEEDRA